MSIYPTSIHVRRQGEKKRACCARCMFVNSLNTKYTTHTPQKKQSNTQLVVWSCVRCVCFMQHTACACVCVITNTAVASTTECIHILWGYGSSACCCWCYCAHGSFPSFSPISLEILCVACSVPIWIVCARIFPHRYSTSRENLLAFIRVAFHLAWLILPSAIQSNRRTFVCVAVHRNKHFRFEILPRARVFTYGMNFWTTLNILILISSIITSSLSRVYRVVWFFPQTVFVVVFNLL